jgi:hypothetical protein
LNWNDVKERFADEFQAFKARLEDSPTYNTAKERFETLSPTVQKAIVWGGIALVSLALFSCPLSFWTASQDNIARYDETRDMIRKLLRTSHLANQAQQGPSQIALPELESLVQARLGEASLLPEQIVGVQPIEAQTLGPLLAPKEILQEALQVSLKKLNLRQISDLGFRMQELHESVKLSGLEISSNSENDHYFDVIFKLVKFSLPMPEGGSEPESPPAGAAPPAGRPRGQAVTPPGGTNEPPPANQNTNQNTEQEFQE